MAKEEMSNFDKENSKDKTDELYDMFKKSDQKDKKSRREFLRKSMGFGVVSVSGIWLVKNANADSTAKDPGNAKKSNDTGCSCLSSDCRCDCNKNGDADCKCYPEDGFAPDVSSASGANDVKERVSEKNNGYIHTWVMNNEGKPVPYCDCYNKCICDVSVSDCGCATDGNALDLKMDKYTKHFNKITANNSSSEFNKNFKEKAGESEDDYDASWKAGDYPKE